MKYADHVNFTVLEISDVDIGTEFTHIKQWAIKNKMVINLQKNMEMVFQRPNPRNIVYPAPFDGIAQVQIAKFLGVFFCRATSAVRNTSNILTVRSQSMYLLKCLKAKGLPISKLHNICQAIIISRIMCTIPA